MAHYALLNEEKVVISVIAGVDEETEDTDWEKFYGQLYGCECKRTSYNTHGGVHVNGGVPFRKNYAGIDYTYDETRDAFIPPKPYQSWLLNEDTCQWEAPSPIPTDAVFYEWNEEVGGWTAIEIPVPDDYDPATDPLMIEWLANAEHSRSPDN